MQPKYFCQFLISKKYFILQNINQSKNIYCILLVLMCYIKYLSGYISYFDSGCWLIFFLYAGNLKMKHAWKQRILCLPLSICLI
jgi:hypothetical protein